MELIVADGNMCKGLREIQKYSTLHVRQHFQGHGASFLARPRECDGMKSERQ